MRTNNTPLTILAIAIGLMLVLPQFRACIDWSVEGQKT